MARIKIRYLTEYSRVRRGPRYFWQPSTVLRAQGWRIVRLPDIRAAAIVEAERLNAILDAWRRGEDTTDQIPPAAKPPHRIRPALGTVDALIADYRGAEEFTRLRPTTRRGYEQNLVIISDWAGDAPVRTLTPKRIKTFYRKLRPTTPSKANAVVRVIRLLLEYGCSEDWIEANPARKVRLIGTPSTGRLWPREAVQLFARIADRMGRSSIGTAVILNEWLGQREGDLIRLSRSIYREGSLWIRQSKTGAQVKLPVDLVPHLRVRLEEEFARQAAAEVTATTLIVSEVTGRAYTGDNFRHVFATVRAEAAKEMPEIADLWFMHLRHTAVTRLFEAGCELSWITEVTGHKSIKTCEIIIDRYLIHTGKLARLAFEKRLEKERNGA